MQLKMKFLQVHGLPTNDGDYIRPFKMYSDTKHIRAILKKYPYGKVIIHTEAGNVEEWILDHGCHCCCKCRT